MRNRRRARCPGQQRRHEGPGGRARRRVLGDPDGRVEEPRVRHRPGLRPERVKAVEIGALTAGFPQHREEAGAVRTGPVDGVPARGFDQQVPGAGGDHLRPAGARQVIRHKAESRGHRRRVGDRRTECGWRLPGAQALGRPARRNSARPPPLALALAQSVVTSLRQPGALERGQRARTHPP